MPDENLPDPGWTWPEHYPNACPPESAERTNKTVFRVIYENPPTDHSFLPYKIEHPDRTFEGYRDCDASGLSILADKEEAIGLCRLIPAAKGVAKGHLTPESGMIKETPNRRRRSHCTWWVPVEVDAKEGFAVDFLLRGDSE